MIRRLRAVDLRGFGGDLASIKRDTLILLFSPVLALPVPRSRLQSLPSKEAHFSSTFHHTPYGKAHPFPSKSTSFHHPPNSPFHSPTIPFLSNFPYTPLFSYSLFIHYYSPPTFPLHTPFYIFSISLILPEISPFLPLHPYTPPFSTPLIFFFSLPILTPRPPI